MKNTVCSSHITGYIHIQASNVFAKSTKLFLTNVKFEMLLFRYKELYSTSL